MHRGIHHVDVRGRDPDVTDAAGGSPPGGTSRATWPVVGLALVVVGLLAGGGIVLASDGAPGSAPPTLTPTPVTSTPTPVPTIGDAQLAGTYDVRLVVRTAHNLATLAGMVAPVPGMHSADRWTFYPTCLAAAFPCAASWEGHDPPLRPTDGVWTAMVGGPPAACTGGRHVAAPIGFRLVALAGEISAPGWAVQSFTGTWTIAFRCPGFSPSRGTVEIAGHLR
jgi:hypothetical protein